MYLDNLIEIVVNYLLIEVITCLDHYDKFPMVSTLMCMVTYWKRPTMNHDITVSIVMIHQITLLHGL